MKLPRFTINEARVIAGGGTFLLVVGVILLTALDADLRKDDLWKALAQAVVIQGYLGLIVAFLFTGSNDRNKDDAP